MALVECSRQHYDALIDRNLIFQHQSGSLLTPGYCFARSRMNLPLSFRPNSPLRFSTLNSAICCCAATDTPNAEVVLPDGCFVTADKPPGPLLLIHKPG